MRNNSNSLQSVYLGFWVVSHYAPWWKLIQLTVGIKEENTIDLVSTHPKLEHTPSHPPNIIIRNIWVPQFPRESTPSVATCIRIAPTLPHTCHSSCYMPGIFTSTFTFSAHKNTSSISKQNWTNLKERVCCYIFPLKAKTHHLQNEWTTPIFVQPCTGDT